MKLQLPVLLLILLAFVACRKQDIEPEPVGEPVPHEAGPDKTWQELLATSSYTRFRDAWQRSGMEARLKQSGSGFFSVLIPTDKAFDEAGWTADKIKTATAAELDGLLAFYVLPARLMPESMAVIPGNTPVATLSTRSMEGRENWYSRDYLDFVFIGKAGDSLLVDGKGMNKWGRYQQASNGIIYPIEHLVPMPTQTMWEFIEAEPRFSLYRDALLIADSLYKSEWMDFGVMTILQSGEQIGQLTLYAPNNDAFHKHGFNNAEDILNYCLRSWPLPPPDYDENMYYQQPTLSIDSILFAHGMEVYPTLQLYGDARIGKVYFSNDLATNARSLTHLLLQPGQMYYGPPVYISLDFINNNGQPGVKRHGATTPYTGLKTRDIRVFNGVIHEVDDLFIPSN
ncbi:fasciclin domain-containing protein [Chitinophaga arvensicola]|uniref:Fasciclin domain-containing protein n=1 Tax=Chitinophaga arvensicola TaxID=29529 RepID=A0A1I0SB18_9BACT|nr:fasciclin domain-containing protein [Chitinophaga arvensicola]SEW53916.1 Fasciclin domain-containing protein [Chitinophaga arvensicola]